MLAIGSKLDINERQILKNLGYGADAEPPARIISLVDEHLENIHSIIKPSYSYVIKNVDWVAGSITLIEEMVNQLAKDRLVLQASILDAIGSAAAEKLADAVQAQIGEIAHEYGLTISRRFSPGYCDWNIGQQQMLFWALRDNTSGVRLTSTCLMLPQKSVSGIIGIGSSEAENYNPCKTCDRHDCVGRR